MTQYPLMNGPCSSAGGAPSCDSLTFIQERWVQQQVVEGGLCMCVLSRSAFGSATQRVHMCPWPSLSTHVCNSKLVCHPPSGWLVSPSDNNCLVVNGRDCYRAHPHYATSVAC